ncbi:MAG: MlaD family protein [Chthoniobacterales bacterium]
MATKEKLLKTQVGFFVFISLLMLGTMIVYFGRLGDGFKKYYPITATFANASGLIKGADVLMAGAKVGVVATRPALLSEMNGVKVDLQIYENVRIPQGSQFVIGRSGLLGDRYVDILVKEDGGWKQPSIAPGSSVSGSQAGGLDDLTQQMKVMVDQVQEKMQKINTTILSEENLTKIAKTITNLNATSQNFADASKRIGDVITDAQGAIKTGQKTMTTVDQTAQELKSTISDVHGLVTRTKNGEGVIGALLTDRTMAQNLRALILNLKEHGILWYKNTAPGAR